MTKSSDELNNNLDKQSERPSFLFIDGIMTTLIFVGFTSFMAFNAYKTDHSRLSDYKFYVIIILGGMLFSAFSLTLNRIITKIFYASKSSNHEFNLKIAEADSLKETLEEDFFNKLIKINFKYLDAYYSQTHSQANKSFSLSLLAAVIGFIVIISGVVLMYFDKTSPGYVTAGAGVLSEFIAAVFFYLYNKTILKMGEYHHKLVITQNVSLALKISDDLPDAEKVEIKKELINQLSNNVNEHLAGNSK